MRTLFFKNSPRIISTSTAAGPKECSGSIGQFIENKFDNDTLGEKSFEKAETKLLLTALNGAIKNARKTEKNIDVIISGDLLNQIISATFSARKFNVGYLGVYNACATFVESLILGSTLIDGKFAKNVLCGTSSHFSSAERQYRYPLELGSTRPPLSQWTVTGAGACLVSEGTKNSRNVKITSATIGKVVDFGVTDVNNMGAAMAPAAADTIITHFKNTNTYPVDYDLIVTGDLGSFGSRILKDLLFEKGYDIEKQHVDCGEIVYNIAEDEYQGGSGAGCVALVFNSYLYDLLKRKKLKKILLTATGALLSSLSSQQGESIPGIAHAVTVES